MSGQYRGFLPLTAWWVALLLTASVPAPHPREDDHGWDCQTMGNHVCGPPRPWQLPPITP